MNNEREKMLILVGGGHTHRFLITSMIREKLENYNVLLISNYDKQFYSGMASAYMENIYSEDDFSVDLRRLCNKAGISFIEEEVLSVDPTKKTLITSNNKTYEFDLISFDTGSDTAGKKISGAKEFSKSVKPLQNLKVIKNIIKKSVNEKLGIVVIGAGAAGIEMSIAMRKFCDKEKNKNKISIIDSNNEIMDGYDKKIKRIVHKELNKNEIELFTNERVNCIKKDTIIMDSGKEINYGFLMLASGSVAHDLYKKSKFEVDERGYMIVNSYLQNEKYPFVFGAGDCISIKEYDYVKKVGVYAIKEAPILWENIKRAARNKELKKYVAQKEYLAIVSLGNKRGALSYHGFVLSGKIAWNLKDYIDRTFINNYKK